MPPDLSCSRCGAGHSCFLPGGEMGSCKGPLTRPKPSSGITEIPFYLFSLCPPKQVAMKHPSAVTACNLDLENLVTDSNRSIATLAITTLLKTGSESSIDRLMKQISSFMSEISDEFKVPGHAWNTHRPQSEEDTLCLLPHVPQPRPGLTWGLVSLEDVVERGWHVTLHRAQPWEMCTSCLGSLSILFPCEAGEGPE